MSESESGEYLRLSSVKECPICGGRLDRGYFSAPRGAYWTAKRHTAGFILLDRVMPGALWTLDIVPALKCESCGIAVVDFRAPGCTPKSFLKECVECKKDIPIASEECPYCGVRQRREVKP